MNTQKIIITGGHITPAISLIDIIEKMNKFAIVFVGRKYALENDEETSFEYKEVHQRNIPFYNLNAPKLKRENLLTSFLIPIKLFTATLKSIEILLKEKPRVIVSFGGYIALPICLAGKLLGIPIITHEQTMSMGLANKIIARTANTVCISWPEMDTSGIHTKIIYTGNPVRKEFFAKTLRIPEFWPEKETIPKILIMGGSLGSHAINEIVEKNLETFLSSYILIHISGNTAQYRDFERLTMEKSNLPPSLHNRYLLFPHLSAEEVAFIMKKADILIGRAGANTLSEILISKITAILIPLPKGGGQEQEMHADYLTSLGVGKKIIQKGLSGNILTESIKNALQEKEKIKAAFSKLDHTNKSKVAALNLVNEIESLVVQ
ncbi:UDP-N-acetylglucosamine--N-acetylmuramyl-(pentapeptide) pyrophosphoryl-undecaprenol N-acetylglucosamine transferase [Candidatus Gottesmanbacteria bacterium]|nr:UDP-N-acetylglucosamine--N-acetylmuramyl-(pentapeptide) pyrophosphoryl-undecaprenol N-acetylglucosamine transferase [Candidatus Gottesmanbacteria bacterium]